MTGTDSRAMLPGLFRAGDIGVSSEWRDITYDWAPLVTSDGVFIYSYLRDMFDHQRILRPFILDPDGPTKQRIQRVLGRRTGWAIQGPEYLLETVGLVQIEVRYGSSNDAERPQHTATAYYVVGRLDHPALAWPIVDRVLEVLMPALQVQAAGGTSTERQKQAEAALRSLGHAGMLQNCDAEDIFDPDGAWPSLLASLIQDERWAALFASLHGVAAIQPYRTQARAWIEWTQRRGARLMQENRAIADQLLAAQRRGQRGGNHGGSGDGSPPTPNAVPLGCVPTSASQAEVTRANFNNPGTGGAEGVAVTERPSVPRLSLVRPEGLSVTQTASGTDARIKRHHAEKTGRAPLPRVSPNHESIKVIRSSEEDRTETGIGTGAPTMERPRVGMPEMLPYVAPHLRDEELTSTRQDVHFWRAVQQTLYDQDGRYNHSEAEKKAVRRLANRTGAPNGVFLAALRAVMALLPDQRPRTLGEVLKLDMFHECLQQAIALLPAAPAVLSPQPTGSWDEFLHEYRAVGQASRLRDVDVEDYHVLRSMFERQPDGCWEILSRVKHAVEVPDLTPAYFRRALLNNQQAAVEAARRPPPVPCGHSANARVQTPLRQPVVTADGVEDIRRRLLENEGLRADMLTDVLTVDTIRLWIAEADERRGEIFNRPGWLKWGLESGHLPTTHPQLRPVTKRSPPSIPATHQETNDASAAAPEDGFGLAELWQTALTRLRAELSRNEYTVWVEPCRLVALELGAGQSATALVATPNVFVREEVEQRYKQAISVALGAQLGQPIQVEAVIGS